jgi:acetate kinase
VRCILTINGGSSSVKFALYDASAPEPRRLMRGQVERIGQPGSAISTDASADDSARRFDVSVADHREAAEQLVQWLIDRAGTEAVVAVGHRVVHGGSHLVEHQLITDDLIAALKRMEPLDLAHLPREIALIETIRARLPDVAQVACFDTAFHRHLPRVAQLLPIPRRYLDQGVRRFGFHGLSYTYLMKELRRSGGADAANGRVILAHLGSGASMVAMRDGKPMDTTMAFTPTAGLVMGTRPGDIDPGLLIYLMRVEKLSPAEMDDFVSNRCGVVGVSDTSADTRDLIARREKGDGRAAEAVDLFCYQAKKFIGAYAAVLGGLDTLVFSAGVGEHSAELRQEICTGLEFLGVRIDRERNVANAPIVSADDSCVTVRVIPTDEEAVIVRSVRSIMSTLSEKPHG